MFKIAFSFNIIRRHFVVDRKFVLIFEIMRSNQFCLSHDKSCRVNREFLKCKNCYWNNWICNLFLNYREMNKTIKKIAKLNNRILKTRLKLIKLKKQKNYWLCRFRDLNDAESRNILKIEAKNAVAKSLISQHSVVSFSKKIFIDSFFLIMSSSTFDNFLREFFSVDNEIVEISFNSFSNV